MKNYDQWKNDYIRKDASRKYSSDKDLKSKYDDYINQSGESIGESMPSNKESSSSNMTSHTDQTQQEILIQLKQINWAVRIGFLFIMAVVSGIIKPGIFG